MPVVAFGISFHVTKVVFVRQFTHSIQIRTCTSWSLESCLSPPLFTALLAFFCFPILSATILQLFYLPPLVLLSACSTTLSLFPWAAPGVTLVFAVLPSISSVVRSVSSLSFRLLMLPAAILAGKNASSKPQTAHGPWASFLRALPVLLLVTYVWTVVILQILF
jgi:hypothetical protein